MIEQIIHLMEGKFPLSPELIQALRKYIDFITIPAGRYILRPKQQCDYVYLVLKGLLRCYSVAAGKERTIWFRKNLQVTFPVSGFCMRKSAQEYIVAIEQTELAFISFEHREELRRRFVEFAYLDGYFTAECLADQVCHSKIYWLNAEQRYNWFLRFHHDLLPRVPLRHIASFLFMEVETLSRTRASLSRRKQSS